MITSNRETEVGRYLMVIEYDRVHTRDLYDGKANVEIQDLFKQLSAEGEATPESIRSEDRWAELVVPEWVEDYTDWELIAE